MQAPFDIAADLDTPVSAFLKLASLRPRFLLESVEVSEKWARYSIIGFDPAWVVQVAGGPQQALLGLVGLEMVEVDKCRLERVERVEVRLEPGARASCSSACSRTNLPWI